MSTSYHVYSNSGSGPIDYASPIATTAALTWTSGQLAAPGDWKFGVRAFDTVTALEEQNLDCAVEIVLSATGADITNEPGPPSGLRAFAQPSAAIRVEWRYPPTPAPTVPTGFHVYIGTPSVSYSAPAATVLYSAGIVSVFQANLSGLTDGDVYSVGVRAFNASGEESNTSTVTVTADATGPSSVTGLTGTAIV